MMRDKLSTDAKLMAGLNWGLPIGRKMVLSYARPYAIWARTRIALTDLVRAGYLTETRDQNGVHFKQGPWGPQCSEFAKFAMKNAAKAEGLMLSAMSEDEVRKHGPAPSDLSGDGR